MKKGKTKKNNELNAEITSLRQKQFEEDLELAIKLLSRHGVVGVEMERQLFHISEYELTPGMSLYTLTLKR